MNSKRIGNISEAKILAKCVEKQWVVLLPFGDNERYDLVIDRGGGFERVQVKTGRLRNGVIIFNAHSTVGRARTNSHKGYLGEADLFGVYSSELDKVYLVSVNNVGSTVVSLRVDEPKLNINTINWAKDFEI